MSVVVDTDVLIDHLRGERTAREVLRTAVESEGRIHASVLSKLELLAGTRPGEESALHRLSTAIDWYPVDEGIAERAGALARRYRASHGGIDAVDYVIAATTEKLNASLLTRNVRHYPMFPDLAGAY